MKKRFKASLSVRTRNIKGLIILSLLIFLAINSNSQDLSSFKYFVGLSEPDSDWNRKDYIDTSWTPGQYSIGYGDSDDHVIIDTTASIYLRYKLDLPKTYLNNKYPIVFNFDFDDGFIAYLNGKEILRVNMDTSIKKPNHLQTTIRSHEAENYRRSDWNYQLPEGAYRPVQGYYIDTATLSNCNLDTSNILAVEVHNDSIKGSDMSFSCSYVIIDNSFQYNLYWDKSRFTNPVNLDSIKLPIIKIETDEYGCNLEDAITFMGIINNGYGKYNKPSDPYRDYKGRIRMKLHGQTSRDFPKKSFKIELQDSTGKNIDSSLLGMPKGNDWILFAPFADKSLFRNEFTFKMGRKMGHYEPRTRYCEFILNGRDMGLYALTEQIKRDNKRVNVKKLDTTTNSGVDITGGYLFRFDKDIEGEIQIIYPNEDKITDQQKEYIKAFYDTSQMILLSDSFTDPVKGYRKYIDEYSLADYFLINELTMNIDAYFYSCYLYKDRNDTDMRIKYGPLWDYDFSMGYCIWYDIPTTGWRYKSRERLNIARILQDSLFTKLLSEKWYTYRNGIFNVDSIKNYINNLTDTMEPYITRNYRIWPIIQYAYNNYIAVNAGTTYPSEIEKWKTWLVNRIIWMDANIDKLFVPVDMPVLYSENEKDKAFLFCYPNPFRDYLNVALKISCQGTYKIAVYDLMGKEIIEYGEHYLNKGVFEKTYQIPKNLKQGIFVITVYRNNIPLITRKIVKL